MSWTLLGGLALALFAGLLVALARRRELRRMQRSLRERERVSRHGSDALLRHPVIDLSRCLGCGTCVAACPEDGVLELVHGQAMVVNGTRCEGISACERECPVGAVTVTIANLEERTDVPVVSASLEAEGLPGVFLAGEVTAHALIKTAIDHGVAVGAEVARRVTHDGQDRDRQDADANVLDLAIVGAGPAGIACSLEAKRQGLSFVTLDQEASLGGTVAKYPRRKLVLTQPMELPLYGRLEQTSFTKEDLMALWTHIASEQELPLHGGEAFSGLTRDDQGHFLVQTTNGSWPARNVCLALGRRGTPRLLGVPGEDLPKVAYSLIDAGSYQGRRILVVGGGDSAVEAALGLAEQPGNQVTLSYRRDSFFRIRARNQERLDQGLAAGKLTLLLKSQVLAIHPDHVELAVEAEAGSQHQVLPNDDVFVMAGGIPPFQLLGEAGVSFDPTLRDKPPAIVEQGTGLARALAAGLALTLMVLAFALWQRDYYLLSAIERPAHSRYDLLRPSKGLGLFFGIASVLMILVNLVYLVRRSPAFAFARGSLKTWMTSHVATGILALLLAMLHGGMESRDTAGGHAFQALAVLLLTGAIGRYFYAWVPRAANGRELELEEVKASLGGMSEEWDTGQRAFRAKVRAAVLELIEEKRWNEGFLARVRSLMTDQTRLSRSLRRLGAEGRSQGVPPADVRETLRLAREAHRSAEMAAHLEDIRGVLNGWRYAHRWVAALMVVLVGVHIFYALLYGESSALYKP